MARSSGKLSSAQREAIYDLKKKGKTGRAIREELKAGYSPTGEEVDRLDPANLSISECNRIAKRLMDERDELFSSRVRDKPPNEGLMILSKRLIVIAERETVRLESAVKRGHLDANKLGKLSSALVRMYGLLERSEGHADPDEPTGQGEDAGAEAVPSSFADTLVRDEDPVEEEAVPSEPPRGAPAPVGDMPLTASGKVRGRPPSGIDRAQQAVPNDLPPNTSKRGDSSDVATNGGLGEGNRGGKRGDVLGEKEEEGEELGRSNFAENQSQILG